MIMWNFSTEYPAKGKAVYIETTLKWYRPKIDVSFNYSKCIDCTQCEGVCIDL